MKNYDGSRGALTGLKTELTKYAEALGAPIDERALKNAGTIESLRGLQKQLSLTYTALTKGAITEPENQRFDAIATNLDTTEAGMQTLFTALDAIDTRRAQKAQFLRGYQATNLTLEGGESAWNNYIKANPVLLGSGTDIEVNTQSLNSDWRPYVTGNQKTQQPTQNNVMRFEDLPE